MKSDGSNIKGTIRVQDNTVQRLINTDRLRTITGLTMECLAYSSMNHLPFNFTRSLQSTQCIYSFNTKSIVVSIEIHTHDQVHRGALSQPPVPILHILSQAVESSLLALGLKDIVPLPGGFFSGP